MEYFEFDDATVFEELPVLPIQRHGEVLGSVVPCRVAVRTNLTGLHKLLCCHLLVLEARLHRHECVGRLICRQRIPDSHAVVHLEVDGHTLSAFVLLD